MSLVAKSKGLHSFCHGSTEFIPLQAGLTMTNNAKRTTTE